jgi:hypothetical protein
MLEYIDENLYFVHRLINLFRTEHDVSETGYDSIL